MKNSILIAILAFTCVSASVVSSSIITTPAKPKEVFTDWYGISSSLTSDIKRYHAKGFIVKTVTSGGGEGSKYILVMEKY
jgi:hypothetical protein